METNLAGAFVLELEHKRDERGFFARAWCQDELRAQGLVDSVSQCSISRNDRAGTLRGMHFQREPHAETKVVRCVRGAIFDVIVDIRQDSATYRQWFGTTLDAEGGRALYIPRGFAHGFQSLVDDTDVLYMISDPYVPEAASGISWDDALLAIEWPGAASRTISDRDRSWPALVQSEDPAISDRDDPSLTGRVGGR